jgi:hypothetical protein
MKNTIKILVLMTLTMLNFSCDNDSNPSPNDNQCNYQGLTYNDANGNIITQIPESDLKTEYYPNNDGPGQAAVEVWDTTNPGNTFIVTRALTVGAVDNNPEIKINGTNLTGTITCQRAGSAVGDDLRFDIVLTSGAEAELCVVIDTVNP